jgi:Restriction endonuclease
LARYDFEALTPYDFELVVRDLLQEQLGGRLETFTPGPDSGIDIRYLGRKGTTELVVQCKKYQGSAWSILRAAVEKELPKIAKLKPKRYMVATTVEMTPDRKDDLYELLAPWMKSPSDVYGRDDINNLLRNYPAIEGRHFKLWLASTEVLQRVLHSEIYRRSERFREAIGFDMRVYVETAALLKRGKCSKASTFA